MGELGSPSVVRPWFVRRRQLSRVRPLRGATNTMMYVRIRRSPFWRYAAFQIPGWILAAVAGWWLHAALGVPRWAAVTMLVVWVIKDVALYPFLRSAYEANNYLPMDRLIGDWGTAVEPLAPRGYVRIRGELWLAEVKPPATIEAGARVQVTDAKGLTLTVHRLRPNDDRG